MCTHKDYGKKLNSMVPIHNRIDISPGFAPQQGCILLSQLLEINT